MTIDPEMFREENGRLVLQEHYIEDRILEAMIGKDAADAYLERLTPERRRAIDEQAKEMLAEMKKMLADEKALRPNQFRCVGCKKIYNKGWSDEEAMAEAVANFGQGLASASTDLMCDDCYNEIHPHKHPDKVASAVLEHMVNPKKP